MLNNLLKAVGLMSVKKADAELKILFDTCASVINEQDKEIYRLKIENRDLRNSLADSRHDRRM